MVSVQCQMVNKSAKALREDATYFNFTKRGIPAAPTEYANSITFYPRVHATTAGTLPPCIIIQ